MLLVAGAKGNDVQRAVLMLPGGVMIINHGPLVYSVCDVTS